MKLTAEQHEALLELSRGLTRATPHAQQLELKGLAVCGKGRFGTWARITDAGQQHLARTASNRGSRAASERGSGYTEHSSIPVAAPGPAAAPDMSSNAVGAAERTAANGHLLRGATPRARRTVATNARVSAAIPSPAAAQDVGATSSTAAASIRAQGPAAKRQVTVSSLPSSPYIAPRTRRGA